MIIPPLFVILIPTDNHHPKQHVQISPSLGNSIFLRVTDLFHSTLV